MTITADEYIVLAQEYRDVCERQAAHARSARDFKNEGLPLLGEYDRRQAEVLHNRIWEILPILQAYEKAR